MQDPIENRMLKSTVEGQLSAADSNTIIELNSKKKPVSTEGLTDQHKDICWSCDLRPETAFHLLQDILFYGTTVHQQ